MFTDTGSLFYQFNQDGYNRQDNKIIIKNFNTFKLTVWSIEGIELPESEVSSIKIFHDTLDIKKRWNNFFEILKYYFKYGNISTWCSEYKDKVVGFSVYDKIYNSESEFQKETGQKRIQQWSNRIKEQIKKENQTILKNFDIEITAGNYCCSGWNDGIVSNQIQNTTIQLFSNQLNLFFIKNKNFDYWFKK